MRPFKLQQGHDNFSETIENGKNVLREAVLFQVSAPQLRTLFATVITQYQPSNPVSLWSMFRDEFPVDFQYRRRRQLEGEFAELTADQKEECYHEALRELDLCLRVYGSSLAEIPEMPQPAAIHEGRSFSILLLRELDRYDSNDLRSRLPSMIASLNPHQRRIFDTIAAAIDSFHNEEDQTENRLFFVDGPGGIGKSFLYNDLLSHVRCKQKFSIAVATSGIAAALLLQVGKTALARSKIPVHDLSSISTCQISIQSKEAQMLKAAELIMWDEAPTAHRYAIEAVDRLLRDIMGAVDASNQIMEAYLKRSALWTHFQVMKLSINMRVQQLRNNDPVAAATPEAFAEYLLRVDDGKEQSIPGTIDWIALQTHWCRLFESVDDIIYSAFPS